MTGLRFIDCQQLKPEQIKRNSQGWYLDFEQQKTGNDNILPISDQARGLIPSEGFGAVDYKNMQRSLKAWTKAARLENFTFHQFRHTFAKLQNDNGTDVVTISKMLGHKSLRSTQVYLKTDLHKKAIAANLIQL